MSEPKSITEKSLKEVYDEVAYKTDIGQKAQVERTVSSGEGAEALNWELQKIGQKLKAREPGLKEAEYLGSAAVHYFKTPTIGQVFFISQPGAIGKTSELIVQDGITAMRSDLMAAFSRPRQKKRSGF